MPVHNADIADKFNQVANLLAIEGGNTFRIRAYRRAARNISNLSRNVSHMVEEGDDLTKLIGIGDDLADKIEEMVETGELGLLKKLKERVPQGLLEMLKISGLGPKRVRELHEQLGITSLEELKEAAENERIRELDGFGEKTEAKIREGISKLGEGESRTLLYVAEQRVEPLLEYLESSESITRTVVAGSYRRRKETVGDIDILMVCYDKTEAMEHFVGYEDVEEVSAHGRDKSTVFLRSGLQVDARAVGEESFGAALHYFTGSQAHNVAIRDRGVGEGLKINEYGVFKKESEERIGGEAEKEVFESVGLTYIPPELREDRGEIDAAEEGYLPELIGVQDVKGDLQSHTTASDGQNTLEEMAVAAKERGLEYLAVTDHSKKVTVANGLDEERLSDQIDEIEQFNDNHEAIRLLRSSEVDILEDGSLDLSDEILERLDVCIIAVHSRFNLPEEEQTERIVKAMHHPNAHILAHPTGRLINEREPYDVDMERVIEAAKDTGTIMEVNASPHRLDMADNHCKMAKEKGVKVAISTDAHSTEELNMMKYGVWQARRGWLEAEDVVNTMSWPDLENLLQEKKSNSND